MYITLNQLKGWAARDACHSGYEKVVETLGPDFSQNEPIALSRFKGVCDLNDVLWCLEKMPLSDEQEKDLRLLACDYADRVLHHFENAYPDDDRPRKAIQAARDFAAGRIGEEELRSARNAAWAAAREARNAAWAARNAAWAAARAAWAAWAAWASAGAAARAAAWAARDAARDAAGDAAGDARDAEREKQEDMLLKLLLTWESDG